MEKDRVRWEQCARARSTKRSPAGLLAHVNEKVETWKGYLAKSSDLYLDTIMPDQHQECSLQDKKAISPEPMPDDELEKAI